MKKRNGRFNPKRKIRELGIDDLALCEELAKKVKYGGNSEHKKNPADFGLTPPSGPRPGKSLCDDAQIFSKKVALDYLKQGLRQGLISEQTNGGWPQNIWAVTKEGMPLEAQLENQTLGVYHGYPVPSSDPQAEEIIQRWNVKNDKI